MFRKKAIDEWALDYWLLQRYAKLCFRIYYRKIEIVNFRKIPRHKPVILAPNHQNALMDAMTLVCNMPFQSVFMARADIFKGKRLTNFLTFMNIMPIYRIRDGIENVKRNDEVFAKTTAVLNNARNPLVLFPEGNHGDRRRLRPLVKGLFRIALLAQEESGIIPAVKIVPIGIDYGHYEHFRDTLFVNIGEPIDVSDFHEEYRANPVNAINHLKEVFAEALGKLIINIRTEEYYALYMHLRDIFNEEMRKVLEIKTEKLTAKFEADKAMIDHLDRALESHPEKIRQLNNLVLPYMADLQKNRLRDWVLSKGSFSVTALVLSALLKLFLAPVFLFGFINNILPYWFSASRVRKIEDRQFHSSFKYVIGMLMFPLWYLVIAGILAILSQPAWFIILYIFLLPLAGLAAFHYYIGLRKLIAQIRYTFRKDSPGLVKLLNTRKRIISVMHDIIGVTVTTHENPR